MLILCAGLSHKTAQVSLRERLAFSEDAAVTALDELRRVHPEAEMVLLSTCNRTELYLARPVHGHPRVEEVAQYLSRSRGVSLDQVAPVLYTHQNEQAIEHLFRVGSGLDAMVLGEGQILGQVRRAYELAREAGTVGRVLHQVFQNALATARTVRRETQIGAGRRSVSSVAVDFARHLYRDLTDKTILTIGAGKMTELTLRHFLEMRPGRLLVCNRSPQRAQALARQHGGEAVPFDTLPDHLATADVVISCTGAGRPIVTETDVSSLQRRRRFRPIFIIDMAVPRDFEPGVGKLDSVYLYDLDDLQRVLAEQQSLRNGELVAAEALLHPRVAECYQSIQTADVAQLIRRLREQLQQIGDAETQRTLNKLQQADADTLPQLLDEHTHRLINKILHGPLSELNRNRSAQAAMFATALRKLFGLEIDTGKKPDPPDDAPALDN